MDIEQSHRISDGSSSLFPARVNQIRISPVRGPASRLTRHSMKPFSSSIIQEKKKPPTKEDLLKITSKIQLIKNKCLKPPTKLPRSDSRRTLNSLGKSDQLLDQSLDLDSDEGPDSPGKGGNRIHMLRSIFPDRPATVFFKYPKCCHLQQIETDRVYPLQNAKMFYKISGSEYKCIVNSLQCNGFRRSEQPNDWSVYFDVSGTHLKVIEGMSRQQKFNHFPGCWQLGRKDYMWKCLNKLRRSHPDAYNFTPTTYLFPSDYERFEIARQNADKNRLWILKPTNQACGRGIRVVTRDSQVRNKKDMLASQYINNPHLINNFKYDLRIYIVVTSYDPLRIYMFEDGLTRFATYQYNTKTKNAGKSVNKHSKKFVKNKKEEKDGQGSKWSLKALKKHYDSIGIDSDKLFAEIKDVIIKTCISAEPVMLDIHSKTQQKRTCGFQLYGFDILIDDRLKPWLMEVNVCPSLSSSSPMDRKIKHTLLTDILNMIGIEKIAVKRAEKQKKKEKERIFNYGNTDKKYYSKNINSLEQLNYHNCLQMLGPQDWKILFESEEELSRAGHFERIFPTRANAENYRKYFEINRYNNNVLWKHLRSEVSFLRRLDQGQ